MIGYFRTEVWVVGGIDIVMDMRTNPQPGIGFTMSDPGSRDDY